MLLLLPAGSNVVTIDTNVLIRLLVDDPGAPDQVALARKTLQAAKQIYIPQIVQVECVWVLQSVYGFSKSDITNQLITLGENIRYLLQDSASFLQALALFKHSTANFEDCLILAESRAKESLLLTFDKKLAKLEGVKLITL